jgi:CrcB protein
VSGTLAWLAAPLVGGVGALARFHLDAFVQRRLSTSAPYGTFVVNLSGAFALGVVAGAAVSGRALLLVGTAFLGSYTTFSTWMLETHRLAEEGERAAGLANVLVSLQAGFVAAWVGIKIGGFL